MTYSYGQNIFRDLLKYSDTHAPNEPIKTAYALQARLGSYFKDNPAATLYNSQKFSGMTNNNQLGGPINKLSFSGITNSNSYKNPLGGPINTSISGTNNIPTVGLCSDEFNFWNFNNNNKENIKLNNQENMINLTNNIIKQNDLIENFNNTENFGNIEYFGDTKTWWIILIIVIFY